MPQRLKRTTEIGQAIDRHVTRRHFFRDCGVGLGSVALASMLGNGPTRAQAAVNPMAPRRPHHRPRAKSVIYLFMAGGPSQLELFDYKPKLAEYDGKAPPDQFMEGKRFAFLKNNVKMLRPYRPFARYGQSGMTLSDLLPHHRDIVDDVCFIKSMQTDVFNHGPAKLFTNTGAPQPGRPSMGSWVTYGLGSEPSSLPGFVVLQSGPRGPRAGSSLWSSGFLPTTYQGVPFRGTGDPILDLTSPKGIDRAQQRDFIDVVNDLNRKRLGVVGDPEIQTRIAAYEMAYRMQSSAPELMDIEKEPKRVLDAYGAEPGKASFANNCLLARRLVERGTRFIQVYHRAWDHHGGIFNALPNKARQVDQPIAALMTDLKQRGLLEDTLVVWGGEFGRTPTMEGLGKGRDHSPVGYTVWMAGGGVKGGQIIGETDPLGYVAIDRPTHPSDLHATVLHALGIDQYALTYPHNGRDELATVLGGNVLHEAFG